ncbi:AMP-binding protein [Robertmurraya sp. GLU-23]
MWNLSHQNYKRVAIIFSNSQRYTYEELNKQILTFSLKIKAARKQLVLILTKNDFSSLMNYLAVLENQDTAMLVSADLDKELLYTIIDSYQPAYILGALSHKDYDEIEDGIYKREHQPSYVIHPEVSLLLSTSGTTGSLKFVKLSFDNILANAKSISEYLQISIEDRGMANLPMHYSYGLSIIHSHLYANASIILTDNSVLSKEFWELFKRERATSFSGVPYTYQMLHRIGFKNMSLPYLRYFTQAGGRLQEKHVRYFGEYALENGKQFFLMYGQTEATARISYLPPERVIDKPLSIGRAIPQGNLSLDQETSELIYEGPNVMLGYAKNWSDLSKGDEHNGKLRTGDIAEVDNEGFFYLKGRMKRFIKLYGLRLNLDDIEKQLEVSLEIEVICIGSDDKLVILIRTDEQQDRIYTLMEKLYRLHRSAISIKIIECIPRLPNGKVNYEQLKEWVT